MEEQKLQELKAKLAGAVPVLTLADLPQEYEDGSPVPFPWSTVLSSTVLADPVRGEFRVTASLVRYVYNCNVYATVPNGVRSGILPVYHAVVEVFAGDQLLSLLFVRDNELLNRMRREFGPSKLGAGGHSLAEIWGQQVAIEIVDAKQKPIPNDGAFTNWYVYPSFGWSDELEQSTFQKKSALAATIVDTLESLLSEDYDGGSSDDWHQNEVPGGADYHVVTDHGELVIKYIAAFLSDGMVIRLIQTDLIMSDVVGEFFKSF